MKQQGTIGIVGGGQLGRMLTEAALPLGFKVIVLNPEPNSSAAQVGAEEIIGDLYDGESLKKLAKVADYITVEIEHLDTKTLAELEKSGKSVNPSAQTLSMIQDKLLQKQFLRQNGIPVGDFVEITDETSAQKALEEFDGRMLIKTRRDAFDGRGNMIINSEADLKQAFEIFKDKQLYAERFVPFTKELATQIARSTSGDIKLYPVVETVHERNICVEVLAPAQIDPDIIDKANQVALDCAKHLEGAGVFAIEMFLTQAGEILVNEIAPRVHNSGHYTIEGCATSQFEQHIRAITGMELGPTNLTVPAAVMVNILGERDGPVELKGVEQAGQDGHTKVHIYGKSPTKLDRKMGHLTSVGESVEQATERARAARKLISI